MSSSRRFAYAWTAIVLGTLAILAIPAGGVASELFGGVGVLFASIIAVPAAFGLGLVGLALSRRASFLLERSVRRTGARAIRFGRILVWTGLYLSVTGALALGFYGALRARS